jgi:hypothetical protein
MATSTIVPAALSSQRTKPPKPAPRDIRLEILDASTPLPILRQVAETIILALELGSPVWDNMVPPPQAPLDVQFERAALQHRMALRDSRDGKIYVRAVGTFDDGEEKTVGATIWQKPGCVYHTVRREEMAEEDKEAFEGYDLTFRDAFLGGFRQHRDALMGDELYW